MNIVFLNPNSNLGGAERVLLSVIRALRENNAHDTMTLILFRSGPLIKQAELFGVSTVVLPLPKTIELFSEHSNKSVWARIKLVFDLLTQLPLLIKYIAQLNTVFSKARPDIIHSNGLKMHILGAATKPRYSRMIWHFHDYISTRPIIKNLLRCFSQKCDVAIAISKSIAADLNCSVKKLKVRTIYNSVDETRFITNGLVKEIPCASISGRVRPATFKIGLIASYARWKGHGVFMKALSRLKDVELIQGVIIGAGIYDTDKSQYSQSDMELLAEKHDVRNRITFIGFQDDVAGIIRGLDLVVHTSTEPEPFGLAIIEAMACGKPVIISRAGGAAEIAEMFPGVLWIRPGDDVALAGHIRSLSENKQLCEKLSSEGRRIVEQYFTYPKYAEQIRAVYHELNK